MSELPSSCLKADLESGPSRGAMFFGLSIMGMHLQPQGFASIVSRPPPPTVGSRPPFDDYLFAPVQPGGGLLLKS